MIVISNGIECFCLPDCAVCQSCHKRMNDIQECPEHNDTCNADCDYYAELWNEDELKEELAKDENKFCLTRRKNENAYFIAEEAVIRHDKVGREERRVPGV